jgi:hypothetical protein
MVLAGAAFVIGRIRNPTVRDSNALLAVQVPMLALCLWLAGRLSSTVTPLIVLCGVTILGVALAVVIAAPRGGFLAEEEIRAAPLSARFTWLSVAATLLALIAPLIPGARSMGAELFYAVGALPLAVFGILHRRTMSALSPTVRGVTYGCAVLSAVVIGGVFGFLTYFMFALALHLPEQYFRAGMVVFSALPAGLVAIGVLHFRLRRSGTWHPIAPLVALHLSWIGASVLILPSAFAGLLSGFASGSETQLRAPGYLLTLSAAASIAALVSARPSARRAAATAGQPTTAGI